MKTKIQYLKKFNWYNPSMSTVDIESTLYLGFLITHFNVESLLGKYLNLLIAEDPMQSK